MSSKIGESISISAIGLKESIIRMEEIVVGKNVQILDFFLQGEKDWLSAEERRFSERVSLSERKGREGKRKGGKAKEKDTIFQ